jgi:ankyrin repeat protein
VARSDVPDVEKAFFKAVKAGGLAAIRALLAANPKLVAATDAEGATPLHHAAWKGFESVAGLLLEAGAEVDAQSSNAHYGGTALHAASHGNHRRVAELLISHGAAVNSMSCNGRTPLEETGVHKATAVANLLKLHGAS